MVRVLLSLFLFLNLFTISSIWAGTGIDYNDVSCKGAWLMDVDEDPLTDDSGENNDLTLKGAGEPNFKQTTPNPPASYSTAYYHFDGSDDYARWSDSDGSLDSVSDNISLVSWVYPLSVPGASHHHAIMGKWSGTNNANYGMFYGTWANVNKKLLFVWFSGGWKEGASDTDVEIDTWTHCATTYDGTTVRLYLDGVADGTPAVSASLVPSNDPFYVGIRGTQFSFDGHIDEPGVFIDNVLTLTEINDIMDNGLQPSVAAGVIKTLNGLPWASVKTYNGLAIGSVKTINSVAAQ